MAEEKVRCFIALDLPVEIKQEVARIQEELEQENLFSGKFIQVQNMHLTLKFLGEIDAEKVEKVVESLRSIKSRQFEANMPEIGVFSEKIIRIIWLKLEGNVIELQRKVDDALEGLFDKERRFMSHITIARVRNVKDKEKLLEHIGSCKLNDSSGVINSFSLMKSTLTPQGPVYEVIEKYDLE